MSRHRPKPAASGANDEVDKISFRLFSPYTALVAEHSKAAKLSPNQYARLATMALADSDLLDLRGCVTRIEDQLIRLRKDFNDALE